MFRSFQDFIIVKMSSPFENHAKFKGVGGKEIHLDHRFDPMVHARIYGEVVSVPKRISKIPITQDHNGSPGYHGMSKYKYRYMSDIEPEAKVGDRLYFHFNSAINKANWVDVQGSGDDKTWYVRIRYDAALCVVREGNIIMIGGWVLCEPDFETWEDILLPVPMVVNGKPMLDKNGEIILKPKDQWIQKKVAPEAKALRAYVRHIGEPLKGDVCENKQGDHIVYRRMADWKIRVEGQEFYCIRMSHILGTLIAN